MPERSAMSRRKYSPSERFKGARRCPPRPRPRPWTGTGFADPIVVHNKGSGCDITGCFQARPGWRRTRRAIRPVVAAG
jgi:hypothetical protein